MLNCRIICIGKLKEKYHAQAVAEYQKRLSKYCKLEIIELPDERVPEDFSPQQIKSAVEREGEKIIARLAQKQSEERVIALCIGGDSYSSEEWASRIDQMMSRGVSRVTFLIGGSNGLSEEAISRADEKLSFSKFTFSHQMMRPILLEQIYRAMKIIAKESYHK